MNKFISKSDPAETFSVSKGVKALASAAGTGVFVGLFSLLAANVCFAQTGSSNTDNYSTIQKDLKQDSLSDALRRIQVLEQESRFLARRIELLERNVSDIKSDRY